MSFSGLPGLVSGLIGLTGESLTVIHETGGTFSAANQALTGETTTSMTTIGVVRLVTQGIDGVTVQRGDLEVWIAAPDVDSLDIGDVIVRESSSEKLTVLEVEHAMPFDYYRALCRGAK